MRLIAGGREPPIKTKKLSLINADVKRNGQKILKKCNFLIVLLGIRININFFALI
jgi:hypothetical protein